MASKRPPLDEELSQSSVLTGRPLDMRIVPAGDKGDETTVEAIHAMNMLRIAEESEGISQVEYNFLVELFNNFGGLSKEWFDGRLYAYSLLKNPRVRKQSEGMRRLYAGFKDFFVGLTSPTKWAILNSQGENAACDELEKNLGDESAIADFYAHVNKQKDHLNQNKGQDWSILNAVDDCWYILFQGQYGETEGIKPQVYLPKIQKTEPAMKLVKGLVHQVLNDGKIDEMEKEIMRELLFKRFDGFGTVDQACIDKMAYDISVKDILFNLALTGSLNDVEIPRGVSGEFMEEMFKIPEKVDKAKKLLGKFGTGIDDESLHLAVYALQNMIGIRGLTNCGLILSDCGVESERLEKMGLHDMPAIKDLSQDMDYLSQCEYDVIRKLVQANPGRF